MLIITFLADKMKKNAEKQKMSTLELQKAVIDYRVQIPQLYQQLLRKEREILQKNLSKATFNFERKSTAQLPPVKEFNTEINIDPSRNRILETRVWSIFT